MLYGIFKGNVEDVEDARQEILIELYTKARNFRFHSSFKTYLYRIARNRAIDILRKKGRDRAKIAKLKDYQMVREARDPQEIALEMDRRENVLAALFKLKEEERTMLIARDVEGLSLNEIAEVYGIPLGTVKSKLHRARDRIIGYLDKDF